MKAQRALSGRGYECACGGVCSHCRAGQSVGERRAFQLSHSWKAPIPAVVDEVLESPGNPLDASTRARLEPRFGHDFGKVRIHDDRRAAAAAAAVRARAFTVGNDIVIGAGQPMAGSAAGHGLLAHELTHVMQQSRAPAGGVVLQRSGLEDAYTTEGQLAYGPTPTADLAAGLPEPDCRVRFADLFILGAIYHPQRPECCFAQIHDRKDPNRNDIFRADYLIEGKPDCQYGDQKSHDFWVGPWRIVEITTTHMTVINMCGEEETLQAEQTQAVGPTQPAVAQGLKTVELSDTNFGPGTVTISDDCGKIVFQPTDKSKSTETWTVITKGQNDQFFIRNGDETNLYPPPQVEDYFRLYLLGDKCGEPKPKQVEEPSPDEMIP